MQHTTLRRELVETKDWYPPTCRAHFEELARYCGDRTRDKRDALSVITDVEYHAVTTSGRGLIRGYSHDRLNPVSEFTLTVVDSESGDRTPLPLSEILKIERVGPVPTKYQPA